MTFFCRKPFVLLVGDESSVLLPPNGKDPLFWDNNDINADKEVHAFLQSSPFRQKILLADTQAQEIKVEAIPPLRALDRQALLKRRLQQKFPPASLKKALPLGKAKDKALFVALHDCATLTAWKARLAKTLRPSIKIALLPFEACRHLLPMIPEADKGWAFLMIEMQTGGWRQILSFQGQPVFTRQSPLLPSTASEAEINSSLRSDLMALLGYLPRLGLDVCESISGVVVSSQKVSLSLPSADMKLGTVLFITADEAAAQLGLKKQTHGTLCPDLLLAMACQQKGAALTFLAKTRDGFGQNNPLAYLLKGITAAVWALALFYCLLAVEQPFSLLMQRQALLAEIEAQQESRRALFKAEKWTPEDVRARDALMRKKLFSREAAPPWPFLEKLAPLLGPELTLAGFNWERENPLTPTENIKFTLQPAATLDPKKTAEASEAFYLRLKQITSSRASLSPESIILTPCDLHTPCTPEIALTINGDRL